MLAVMAGYPTLVQQLLSLERPVDVNAVSNFGETATTLALADGRYDIFEILVKAGATH